jgi:cation diffusion facilitator CzcD-associated flavoprotein CzcO
MAMDIGRRAFRRAARAAHTEGRPVPSVAIVGGGLSGLAMGIQLSRSGVRDFTIFEQSDGVGGTWRDNTYPGSGCDVPSHLYSFSFAPKTDWTRRFAEQPEILCYAERCVERFHLGPHLRLGTTVQRAEFDEDRGVWTLSLTSAGGETEVLEADTVVFACGQLNRPYVPELDGLATFAGPSWHSARWDHRCDLNGRRVGVVGSGASAIQFVPPVAGRCAELTIYQRSPNYVGPKKDRAYSSVTRRLLDRVRVAEVAYRWWIYWGLEARWLWFRKNSWASRKLTGLFATGIRKDVVSERLPEASVVPDYPIGCKRILISNDWYPTLKRPTVRVVDTPIDHLEPDAVVTADGARHPTDVLVFATGFSSTDFLGHIPVTGRGGRTLADEWKHGAHAYLGTAVPGFPNCYFLYGPNTNLGHNSILFMVERQVNLILQALAVQTEAAGGRVAPLVGVGVDAYRRDDQRTQRLMTRTAWAANCRSWYKTATGRVTNNWPTWTVRYWYDTLRLRPSDVGLVGPAPGGAPPAAAPAGGPRETTEPRGWTPPGPAHGVPDPT